jgi:hypothetical protein
MLVASVLLLGYQLTTPRAGRVTTRAAAARLSAAEDAAKQAWLAKQDVPAFGAAAASSGGQAVSSGPMSSAGEEAAKKAWLARMDAPAWGAAAAAVAAASSSAAMTEACDQGVEEACDGISREEEAKRAWLAKLDAPTWGAVAAAVSEVAAGVGPASADEDAAKKAWLARLDAPTWGKAATALVDIAGSAGAVAAMEEACDEGVEEACDGLSREEEAKAAWLAKMDAPTWGAVTAAVSAVSAEMSSVAGRSIGGAMTAEEIAKHNWLAAMPEPGAWRKASLVTQPAGAAEVASHTAGSSELEAKAAWLAKMDLPQWGPGASAPTGAAPSASNALSAEEAAKQAWLAKMDAPAWGKAAAAVAAAGSMAALDEACAQEVEEACDGLSVEEEAKRAWLARLDTPSWGAVAAAVSEISSSVGPGGDDEAAKKAWLARLDAPTWGKAAAALVDIAGSAGAMGAMEEACDQGVEEACAGLSSEEEAKAAWLAKLDTPTWGAVTAAVSAVASAVSVGGGGAVSAEQIAKQKWLAAQDQAFKR